MDWAKTAPFLMALLLAVSRISMGVLHKIGDSAGWAVIGNPNFYGKWASARVFQLGDTILFEYDPKAHSVLEVSRSKFHGCDTTSPLTTYSTGNDTVKLKNAGHFYYICGFPGHCQAGQKVDIRVPKNNTQTVSLIPGPDEATIQFSPEDSPPRSGSGGLSVNNAVPLISSSLLLSTNLGVYLLFLGACRL